MRVKSKAGPSCVAVPFAPSRGGPRLGVNPSWHPACRSLSKPCALVKCSPCWRKGPLFLIQQQTKVNQNWIQIPSTTGHGASFTHNSMLPYPPGLYLVVTSCHLVAPWPWTCYLSYLSLSFPSCSIIIFHLYVISEIKVLINLYNTKF